MHVYIKECVNLLTMTTKYVGVVNMYSHLHMHMITALYIITTQYWNFETFSTYTVAV